MKRNHRIKCISMLLLVFLLFSVTACKSADGEPGIQPPEEYDPDKGIDFSSEKKYVVRDQSTSYQILISGSATPAETFAAQELRDYIGKATKVELEIAEDGGKSFQPSDKVISVGNTAALAAVPEQDYSDFRHDGFIIRTNGNSIIINGASDRGTLYGVYDFLEKFAGVKFLTQDSTYIPQLEELYVHDLNIVEIPTFTMRTFLSKQINTNPLFGAHLRMSSVWSNSIAEYGGSYNGDFYSPQDHSFFMLVPPSVYQKAHPDWYSPDGKQLCLTNQEMVAQATENLKEWILSKPESRYFMVGQEDIHALCSCEQCSASDEANGGKSGTLMIFINQLAKAIEGWQAEVCPERDVTIVTFAYQSTINAPVKMVDNKPEPINDRVIPRKNVMIKIAIIDACYFHDITDETCTKNIMTRTVFRNWSALTNRLCLWDYNTNFTNHLWYFANLGVLKSNLVRYEELGMEYLLSQGGTMLAEDYQSQLKCYVFSKLMWNPHRDVTALISEFNKYHFGEDAAEYVNRYLESMELHFKALDQGKTAFHSELYFYGTYFNPENYPIGLLKSAINELETARKVVAESDRTPQEKEIVDNRIVSALITPQMMVLQNYGSYYFDGKERDFAREFFRNTDKIGLVYYSEGGTVASLKEKYGL